MSPAKVVQDWWGDRIKRRLSLLTAALVAILTTMHFGEVMEPKWIATRGFVRDLVESSSKTNTSQFLALQIATKESARDNTQAQIDRLEYELKKNPDSSDSIKQILTEQIRRYSDQLRILNLELDDLRRRASGQRP